MLLVILVIGLLLMLLHTIGAFALSHDLLVVIDVICLGIALVAGLSGARDRRWI
jgi:hypothetical protein